jgi:hypothetical protein
LRNRIVLSFLFASSLALGVFLFWTQGHTIDPENFYYQPLVIKLFVFINFPAILLAGLVFTPFFNADSDGSKLTTTLYFGILLVSYFGQWCLIGYLASKVWRRDSLANKLDKIQ